MKTFNNNFFNLLLLFSLLAATINSFAANINVSTDRNPVRLNESFRIVFETEGSISGNPDFSPLQTDFDILNQSQNSQINIINGQQRSTKKWVLTVMAKRTGHLVIPSIDFGQERTAPSSITVQEVQQSGEAESNLFLEVEVEPKNPYVQSEVIYTVRLLFAINIKNASLTEPKFKDGEGIVEKLGEDVQYKTQRDGKHFMVLERKYAIFPQESGDLILEPVMLEAQISKGRRSHSLFDDFFDRQAYIKRSRSESIALKVKPIPDSFKGRVWLPAKHLKLQENWSETPQIFKAGEPATRTLTLLAEGLTAGQLPELSLFPKTSLSKALKQYPDKAKLDEQGTSEGIISRREEKVAIIPSEGGSYTLPAIEVPWWNTKTHRIEIASLPARTIEVQPADVQPVDNVASPQTTSAPLVKRDSGDKIESAEPIKVPTEAVTNYGNWLNFILALGWLGTVIAWWLTSRRTTPKPVQNTPNDKTAIKRLKLACQSDDVKGAKEALIIWAKVHWQNHNNLKEINSLGEICQHCDKPLQTEIQILNRLLYSQKTESWEGSRLWEVFKTYKTPSSENRVVVEGLVPLYQRGSTTN
jgi:hypothetical protein